MYIGHSHEDHFFFFFTVSLQIQSFVQEKKNKSLGNLILLQRKYKTTVKVQRIQSEGLDRLGNGQKFQVDFVLEGKLFL